jgi:hypothetical protein
VGRSVARVTSEQTVSQKQDSGPGGGGNPGSGADKPLQRVHGEERGR